MTGIYNVISVALLCTCVGSLIIPDEITSLLSLIYSNIPPIKKGTDSRVGVGFRLGPHADFQVLLELGPQSNTQPIGPSAETKRRRHSDVGSSVDRKDSVVGENVSGTRTTTSNALPVTWLDKWRMSLLKQSQPAVKVVDQPNQPLKRRADKPAPARPLRPYTEPTPVEGDDVVKHLHQLFDNKTASADTNVTAIS